MEETFELKSFKLAPWGGAEVKYKISTTDENEITTEQEYHVKVTRPVHPDLVNLFTHDLTAIVADILDNTEITASLELGNVRIQPVGVSFAGKNDNIGIGINGFYRAKAAYISFKIPRIKYKTGTADYCAKLTVFADNLVNEVHAYLFEGKQEELEPFE